MILVQGVGGVLLIDAGHASALDPEGLLPVESHDLDFRSTLNSRRIASTRAVSSSARARTCSSSSFDIGRRGLADTGSAGTGAGAGSGPSSSRAAALMTADSEDGCMER